MKKCSFVLIAIGTTLIISALFLCLYNFFEDRKSGKKAQDVLNLLKSEIAVESDTNNNYLNENKIFEQIQDNYKSEIISNTDASSSERVNEKEVEGISYLGFITIPTLNLELPVSSHMNESILSWAPCIYSGSAPTGNFIIAAHNYSSHFRNIDELAAGDVIYYTDADGKVYEYQVSYSEIISGSDPQAMVEGSSDSWDLTLFTCTLDGRNRITVRSIQVQ